MAEHLACTNERLSKELKSGPKPSKLRCEDVLQWKSYWRYLSATTLIGLRMADHRRRRHGCPQTLYGPRPLKRVVKIVSVRFLTFGVVTLHDRDELESRTYCRRSARTRSAVPKAPRVLIVYGCNEATYADRSTMSSSVSFITTGFIVDAFFPSRVPLLKS